MRLIPKTREQMWSGGKMPDFSDKAIQTYKFNPLRSSHCLIYYHVRHSQTIIL